MLLGAISFVAIPVLTASPAQAATQQVFDGPNGSVSAIAVEADGTAYVGGAFTAWGPQTGGGALLDSATAAVDRTFPPVTGTISAVVDDGAGGWYIGGNFTAVAGVARTRLAHILPSGELDASWAPQANGAVLRLVRSGSVIYAAGEFTALCGTGSSCGASVTRQYLAAINSDGTVNSWNPHANAAVLGMTMSNDGATVYVGGNFTTMCGVANSCDPTPQARSYLAAIGTDGTLGSWSPTPGAGRSGTWVRALAASGSRIYIGGNFTTMNGSARGGLAAVSLTGVLDGSWAPSVTGGYPDVQALVVSPDDSTVYVAGDFGAINGTTRPYLGAVNASDGATTPWYPNPSGKIWGLVATGSTVYAAGEFSTVCGAGTSCEQSPQARSRFAAFGADGSLAAWDPNVNNSGYLNTVAISGSSVYIGGNFNTVGATPRNRLAAVNSSGNLTSWDPNASGNVSALALSGSTIYAGGSFTTVGGATRNRIAAINPDGSLSTWDPNANNAVSAITVSGTTVYAGGSFTVIGGQTRNRIAAIDDSGTATSWNPNASGTVSALAVSGSTIYAGGAFTTFGGQPRNRLASVDSSGSVTSWAPAADNTVSALSVSGSTIYAGGTFTNIGGQARNRIAALTSGGSIASFNANAGGAVNAVSVSGSTVYAGGAFSSIGGATRSRVAAMSSGGTATSWDPSASGTVSALRISGSTAYVGGSFTSIGYLTRGTYAAYFAAIPTAAPSAPGVPTAVAGDAQAAVTVTPPVSGAAVTSYTVTSTPDSRTCIVNDSSGSCTVTGLTNGTPYTFRSTATNGVGTSGASVASTAVTPWALPTAPTALVATPGDGSADIAFTAGSAGTMPITNYAYTLDDSTWVALSPDDTTSLITITGLTNGATYSIKLRAISAAGNGAASTAVPVTPRTTPSAPTSLVATPGSGSVEIAFTPGPDGGSPVTNYAYTLDDSTWMTPSPSFTTSPVTVTGLTNGTTYSIKLRGVNAAGPGSPSIAVAVTPASPVPPAPRPASAPVDVTAAAGDASITAAWEPPPASGDFPVTHYRAVASPGGLGCLTSVLSCTITGVTNGTSYTVTVRALTGAGWSAPSEPSNTVTPTPQATCSVRITGSRADGPQGDRVVITGATSNCAAERVRPWFRLRNQAEFRSASHTEEIASDGHFTWSRRARQTIQIYVLAGDSRSNTVTVRRG